MANPLEVGRICIKRKGREAGRKAVVVEVKGNEVLIDGESVRRRKCNPLHLFPTKEKIDLKKGATHKEVVALMKGK